MFRRNLRFANPSERPSGSAAQARIRLLGALAHDRTRAQRPATATPRPAIAEQSDLLELLLAQGMSPEARP